VLAGRRSVRIDDAGVHDPRTLKVAAFTTGMGPVLGRWVEDGAIQGRPAGIRVLGEHLMHARRRAARIEREVLPAFGALIAAGITPVVLKGFHTARVYFEEPGVRRMADVDILVEPSRVDRAEGVLRGLGYRPASPAERPRKRDWIAPGVDDRIFSLEHSDDRSKWTVEVHGSLDREYQLGAVARLDRAADVAECFESFEVRGRHMLALSPPMLLLFLACHASQELDASRLLRLVELVRIVRIGRASDRLDWDSFLAMMRRTDATRFAYPALALVEDLAPGTVDPRVLQAGWKASTRAARHTVARLAPAGGPLDSRGVLRQVMWTRGLLAVTQRLFRSVWPAAVGSPRDAVIGWRARLRRLRSGGLSFRAPDERGAAGDGSHT
jgi:hypothetical protein